MADTATQDPPKRKTTNMAPFGIQADHPRNSDLMIKTLTNVRLRSAFDSGKSATDAKTGQTVAPVDQVLNFARFPKMPGMELHVDPAAGTYVIRDPLSDEPDLLERWADAQRATQGASSDFRLRAVPTQKGTLDADQMKTLVREMVHLLEAGEAKIVKGPQPTLDAVDGMEGRYLTHPSAHVPNSLPKYEDEIPAWTERQRGIL